MRRGLTGFNTLIIYLVTLSTKITQINSILLPTYLLYAREKEFPTNFNTSFVQMSACRWA